MPRAITNVATIGWLASGCGLSAGDIPFVEGDDVVLSVPRARAGADAIHGEAHGLVTQVPAAIDGWVGDVVDEIAAVVAALEDHRETRRDGAFRLYGPFDDPDGRDLAWLVKIDDRREAAAFEVWVGQIGRASCRERV